MFFPSQWIGCQEYHFCGTDCGNQSPMKSCSTRTTPPPLNYVWEQEVASSSNDYQLWIVYLEALSHPFIELDNLHSLEATKTIGCSYSESNLSRMALPTPIHYSRCCSSRYSIYRWGFLSLTQLLYLTQDHFNSWREDCRIWWIIRGLSISTPDLVRALSSLETWWFVFAWDVTWPPTSQRITLDHSGPPQSY